MIRLFDSALPTPRIDEKDRPAGRDGRWRLNAGSEMLVTVPGLNEDKEGIPQPVRLVLDLASINVAGQRIVALSGHNASQVIGYWDNVSVNGAEGLDGDLHIVRPRTPAEEPVLAEAIRLLSLIEQGVPIQVSVGAERGPAGAWEKQEGETPIAINGRFYDPAGDIPLYVLRGGCAFESSIVTFGADGETGRLAAASTTTTAAKTAKESNMADNKAADPSTLKALLAKHGEKHAALVASRFAEGDDAATIEAKVRAEDDKATAELVAGLQAQVAKLQAENEELKKAKAPSDEEKLRAKLAAESAAKGVNAGGDAADTKTVVPKTLTEAILLLAKEKDAPRGIALRRAALAKYPDVARV